MLAAPSGIIHPTNLQSLQDIFSKHAAPSWNETQLHSIPEGTYIGSNIKILGRCLQLSGEQSSGRNSPVARIILKSESERYKNEEKVKVPTGTNCIFSLTNSTLSLETLFFSLVANSEEPGQITTETRIMRLAVVSNSMLTISESRIEVSRWTSPILISPSTSEESSASSSVVVKNCLIWNDIGEMRGVVESPAFPTLEGSVSVSIVGCSFDSETVLGKDGIGLALTPTARKSGEDIETISSLLIGCSFVNVSSIGSSHQPNLPYLNQKMLGCVVSLTSSHLSGSTIRDMNNGGSVLCSNSSFSSLLSPNTDTDQPPTFTSPNGTTTSFVDDGTEYTFDKDCGTDSTFAKFTHCHFTGANYASNSRPLTFNLYTGTISITSCSFTNHTYISSGSDDLGGGAVCIRQDAVQPSGQVSVQATNFTNITSNKNGAGMFVDISESASIVDCTFKECGTSGKPIVDAGGLYVGINVASALAIVTNLVFEGCFGANGTGGLSLRASGTPLLSDCLFKDCFIAGMGAGTAGLDAYFYGETPRQVTRLNFTDCYTPYNAGGMEFYAFCDILLTDLHFLRCKSGEEWMHSPGGGFLAWLEAPRSLTVQDCSFVDCSANGTGGAFGAWDFGSCVITDCLVKNCYSGEAGAIRLMKMYNTPSSIFLTRIAFVNNSVGPNAGPYRPLCLPENTTGFVDVSVNYINAPTQPTLSIVDCYTTCAKNSAGLHMMTELLSPDDSCTRVFDKAFNNIGPLLTEGVGVLYGPLSGRVELEMKGKMPIPSQKYEVTFQNNEDKTEVKGEVEFVDGKGTLTSPSANLNLDFSTSYTITSIVGIVPSSSSSLSNAITFPTAAWAFNLAATPSFVSFTTPTPPTLFGAKGHLVSSDQPLAYVSVMLTKEVMGSYDIVVEEEGKDITITVEFEESSKMGDSSHFVVVGKDRLLTHNTTYTIKSITPSPGTGSPFVWMNETVSFHIPHFVIVPPKEPEEPEDPKKAMSPETKKLLSWLIPLVGCLLIALLVAIIVIVLLRRRKVKAETSLKELEERTDEQVDEKIEVDMAAPENTNAEIPPQAISHSNFGPDSSLIPTDFGHQQSSKGDGRAELVEVMKCGGDFAVSTARMETTLYSVLHTQKQAVRNRTIGMQIVNGLKHLVTHRGRSDVLTQVSPHWILLDSAGNVHLKLEMNSTEAEQAALLAQKQQNPDAVGTEGGKSGMDGLRWKAPEVAAGNGQVDGQNASVFSLGLILWEIETGLVPYGEVDAIVAQKQSGTGIPPKMSDWHDEEFVALLERCLSLNPKERPTLTEVGEFLSSHKNESAVAESRNEMKTHAG